MVRTDREESTKHAYHDGEKNDQEKAKCRAFATSSLRIDDREGEGAVAAHDGAEIGYTIHDRDGIDK